MDLLALFRKRKYSPFAVDTSLGKVRLFTLTKRVIDKAYAKANVGGDIIHNAVFMQVIEEELVDLPKRKWDDLTLKEWSTIRMTVRTMLNKENILQFPAQEEDKQPNMFSQEEVNWFEQNNPIRK